MIRASHVIAAFVGVALVAWAKVSDPLFPQTAWPIQSVFVAILFAMMWECCVRLFGIVRSLLAGKKRH